MKRAQFLPPTYAPDSPEEINRAQREGSPEPHQIKPNTSKQTLLEELAEIDAAYAEGEVTPEQEKRGAEIVSLANAAHELLGTLKDSREELQTLFNDDYDYAQIDAAIAKATGGVSLPTPR